MMSRLPFTAASAIAIALWLAVDPAYSQAREATAQEATAQTAPAQTAPVQASRATVYPVTFFAPFAPANALDIARHVPGFSLDKAKEDVRGFAGAAGNVVFNGARSSSKSDAIEVQLSRIPASRVLRVEVGPGDLYGSDYAGKSQVLNIVLSAQGGIDGSIKVQGTRYFQGGLIPDAEGSLLLRRGASTFTLAAGGGRADEHPEEGYDRLTAPDGAQVEFRSKINHYHQRDPYVSFNWAMDEAVGRAAHVTLRYGASKLFFDQTNAVTPAIGPQRDDLLLQHHFTPSVELGGDVARPLAGGAIKLVALVNRRSRSTDDTSLKRINSVVIGGAQQVTASHYDETLGRVNWTRARLLGFSVELGGELAFNRLRDVSDLYVLDASGGKTRVPLPISRATVQELRTESYVNAGWQISPGLRLDGGLAYETSQLKVSGDTQAQRSLRFLKPSLTLDFVRKGGWHVQLVARRTVAQLDFYDFISNAELSTGAISGGNPDLQPQRSWELRATVEHPLLGAGQAKLALGHDRVTMLQDRVLTVGGFDAPGNLGAGMRDLARLTLDAPLDQIGLAHFHVRGEGGVQRTSVVDPLTGRARSWSGYLPAWDWSLDLRYDAKAWSLGGSLDKRGPFTFFRTDETDTSIQRAVGINAFAEYRPNKRTILRLDASNLLDGANDRLRTFFAPNRLNPQPSVIEFRRRYAHSAITLSLRRSFGSAKS